MSDEEALKPKPRRGFRSSLAVAAIVSALFLVFLIVSGFLLVYFWTDVLWYDNLGYGEVLWTQWRARIALFILALVTVFVILWVCMHLAWRFRPRYATLGSRLSYYQMVFASLRRVVTVVLALIFAFLAGLASASNWQTILTFLNRTPTGKVDPQFHLDLSFYFFDLPFYRSITSFFREVLLLALVLSVIVALLYGALRFSRREIWLAKGARVQFSILAILILIFQVVSFWLDRYSTLHDSRSSLITGAAYTDVNAVIPGHMVLSIISLIVAGTFLVSAIFGRWRLPIIGTVLLVLSTLVINLILPWGIQRFQVDPNARTLEAKYIARGIEMTRQAYGLSSIDETPYQARTDARAGQLRNDADSTASIRILDPGLVGRAFAQLQQFRQYYNFDRLSVDRYRIDGRVQDAVVSVREINLAGLGSNNSWVNQALVYTHGYGLVAAYGNERTADGEPKFFQSGIPATGRLGNFQQRVYFGLNSPKYSIVGSSDPAKHLEFDFPSGTDGQSQTYTTFEGDGGPKLDSFLKKLLYAVKFQSEQILLSEQVGDYSQILYDRNPLLRVQKAAPWLRLDSHVYPSVVDGRMVWIVDGYTTTDRYPYSAKESFTALSQDSESAPAVIGQGDSVNYIRNSVKATVDAYSGKVTLYAWDPEDPLLRTWSKIFPGTLKPVSDISADLMSHLRYPLEMFNIQREVLARYHVTDPGAFFSNQDAWGIPINPQAKEISSVGESVINGRRVVSSSAQPPYYLSLKMPGQAESSFSIFSTFIPRSTGENSRSVLTGYLAVNSDAGQTAGRPSATYGQIRLLRLSKDQTVPGPGQMQNAFDADPVVGNQLNILRQGGQSRVLPGNLLTLPVGGGFLYVQPVYVQSTGSTSYPLLQKVLAAFGNKIAFESTLSGALDSLFGGNSGASAGDADARRSPPAALSAPHQPPAASPVPQTSEDLLAAIRRVVEQKSEALKRGDMVAYAEADRELTVLLNELLAGK